MHANSRAVDLPRPSVLISYIWTSGSSYSSFCARARRGVTRTLAGFSGATEREPNARLAECARVVCGAHTGNGVEMQDVDQAFLLAFAGVSGTLLGTFVVGVFFYIDSEMHMRLEVSEAADRYQRSSIRWVFTAYSIALFVPLTFAALHPLWGSLAFGLFGVVLLAMTVDCVRRILAKGASGSS